MTRTFLNIDGYPIFCANCGSEDGKLICIGDGETVCSDACYDEHERLGCPFDANPPAYRSRPRPTPIGVVSSLFVGGGM